MWIKKSMGATTTKSEYKPIAEVKKKKAKRDKN